MLKLRYFSTCIFLLTLFSINRICASDYFSNAKKIYSEGKFFEASIEFERAIYYESDSNRIALCKYYKSLCYKELGEYDKALEELRKVNMESVPDSIFLVFSYEQVLCSYLKEDLNQALFNIDKVYLRFKDTLKILEFLPLNIICLNSCREWDNALILWNYYIDNSRLNDSVKRSFKQEVYRLYDKKNVPRFYFANKAENLSTFLPGSGQIYCGAVLEGLFNMSINGTLLYYAFSQLYNQFYCTGYFVGLKLFNKFYAGGIRRAKSLTEEKNQKGIKAFNVKNSNIMNRFYIVNTSPNR
jgi:tetratricopeptide (TPR) repeat protein